MPYELGLDVGCAEFGGKKFKGKRILILETERYHYQKVLSDIAGQDIEHHNDSPAMLVKKIRNWFSAQDTKAQFSSANVIWTAFNRFMDDLSSLLTRENFLPSEIDEMPMSEFIRFAKDWTGIYKTQH
jgi:hypothetical protein